MNKKSPQSNAVMRFSGMGIQMAITIGFFVWLGVKLDRWQQNSKPIYTAVLSLIGTLVAIYTMIKELKKS